MNELLLSVIFIIILVMYHVSMNKYYKLNCGGKVLPPDKESPKLPTMTAFTPTSVPDSREVW
jgi:hypothetical protein